MTRRSACTILLPALFALLLSVAACETKVNRSDVSSDITPPTIADNHARDYPGLHNVVAYHDHFYSGSVPEGEEGFASLQRFGIRTVISVDGAVPDVEAARALGMRYIHLPIGYNGFDQQRKLELIRATRDALADGPVYIHCHHGKHRSAGAAGTIIAGLGWNTAEEMIARMKVSGTSTAYKGLYACTASTVAIAPESINAIEPTFPEISRPQGLVKGMIEIDEVNDRLKLIAQSNWQVPSDHPDLVPVAEAGHMADIFRLLHDDERLQQKPAEMLDMLRSDGRLVQELETMLDAAAPDVKALDATWEMIQAGCKDCHARFRD